MTLELNNVEEESIAATSQIASGLNKEMEARFLGRKMSMPAVDKNDLFSPLR